MGNGLWYSLFMKKTLITAVVAIGKNRELGKNNKLLWHIPDDLKRFKRLTLGHPIIMGRKTFESIVGYIGGPLPGRTNIIVTRSARYESANPLLSSKAYKLPNVFIVGSIEEGIEKAQEENPKEIHIGGGASIYEQALPYIDKLYLTLIDDEKPADTFFPPYEHIFTKKVFEEAREWNGIKYRWVDLEC
jgi:dihydrofolate reductase